MPRAYTQKQVTFGSARLPLVHRISDSKYAQRLRAAGYAVHERLDKWLLDSIDSTGYFTFLDPQLAVSEVLCTVNVSYMKAGTAPFPLLVHPLIFVQEGLRGLEHLSKSGYLHVVAARRSTREIWHRSAVLQQPSGCLGPCSGLQRGRRCSAPDLSHEAGREVSFSRSACLYCEPILWIV
jgi:hypothetical protein